LMIKDTGSTVRAWTIQPDSDRRCTYGQHTRTAGTTWIRIFTTSISMHGTNEQTVRKFPRTRAGGRISTCETRWQSPVSLRHWAARARQQKNPRRDARFSWQDRQVRYRSAMSRGFRKRPARFGGRRGDMARHHRRHRFPHKHEEGFFYLQPSLRGTFCRARQTKSNAHNG